MTDAVVVDASVAIKWLVEEPYSDEARTLLRDALTGYRDIFVPPLLPSEVTNAIFQQQRRARISAAEGDAALAGLFTIPLQLMAPDTLYRDALDLARRFGLPATYDSQYLALARALDADFWTADRRLFNAIPRSFKRAHWIGDYQIGT
ncbi:MAG TPA: type II toxin-antitoxin system VapC family toxin [Dehalococcoidia bacterium]|nr:type II toxin-antitoxin system VapC family toxin [Dehalococcoidia bacterium]